MSESGLGRVNRFPGIQSSIHLWADCVRNRIRSAVREFVVLGDRPLKIVKFIAGDEADLLQSS